MGFDSLKKYQKENLAQGQKILVISKVSTGCHDRRKRRKGAKTLLTAEKQEQMA
jgi:hypothetical protein